MKRRLSAILLTLCLVIGLLPVSVFAAPEARRVNDTEFHIMNKRNIVKVVQNYTGSEQKEINIHKILVHSGVDNVDGSGTNGYVQKHDAWKVQNTSWDHWGGIDDHVTAITICATVDSTGTYHRIPVAIAPEQLKHDVGDIGHHITQIYLNVKLTYDPNGGKEPAVVHEFLEHDAVTVGKDVPFTRENAVLLGFSTKKNGLITTLEAQKQAGIIDANQVYRIDEDTTLYAVWAEDSNKNGKADYLETAKEVTLNIYDIENQKQVKEEKLSVSADAIHVNTS
ncbi:MAG: InlB B-repeat-containing protein, partial [Oscillospiraceae bacterium]|nr:InlB B-repeat-containing protein [Oscillospiraceae bacterium]